MNDKEYQEELEEYRVKNADCSRTTFERLFEDSEKRRSNYARLRNQLEGGLPYNPATKRNRGEAWHTNVNFDDASSAADRVEKPYWDMANNVPSKASLSIDSQAKRSGIWQRDMEQAFDDFLDDWGASYMRQFRLMIREYIRFGYGIPLWKCEDSPRWEAMTSDNVLVHKRASIEPEKWQELFIRDEISLPELFEKVKDEQSEKDESYIGWNPGKVKELICYLKKNAHEDIRNDDWVKVQDEIRNNDLGDSGSYKSIQIVHHYVKNHDGTISHYIFEEKGTIIDEESVRFDNEKEKRGYIYCHESEYDSFSDFIGFLYYEVGNGLFHGVKGFGVRNYHFSVLLNRIKSNLVDSVSISMGLNFKRVDNGNAESPPVENHGIVNIFPRGLEQIAVYPSGKNGFDVLNMLSSNQAENNAQFREQKQQIAETDTAAQAKILAQIGSEMSQADAGLFLTQLAECCYETMFKKLRKKGSKDPDAVKFVKRCKDKGVPEEVIYDMEIKVKSGANANMASSYARQAIWEQMMATGRSFGFNMRWIQENYIANRFGSSAINKALPVDGQDTDVHQTRLAIMENAQMADGVPMPVDPMDMHDKHLPIHAGQIQKMMQKLEQTTELSQEEMIFMDLCWQHIDAHAEFGNQDETMEKMIDGIMGNLNNLRAAYEGYKRRVIEAQQNQQIEEGAINV